MRADIEKYLGTVMQSTEKTIADKLRLDRLSVSRELNAMVSNGILERKLEGTGPRHTEYVYWLTRKDAELMPADGVDMHPKTLPPGAVTIPKTASPVVEEPEVTEAEVSAVEESLDLALQLQAMTLERDELAKKFLTLADKSTVLQLNFDKQAATLEQTVIARDAALAAANEIPGLREALADAIKRGDEWKRKHDELKQRVDQYDERQRFDAWFKARPESKGSDDSTSLKEKMWESWLERSRLVEVAAA